MAHGLCASVPAVVDISPMVARHSRKAAARCYAPLSVSLASRPTDFTRGPDILTVLPGVPILGAKFFPERVECFC